MKQKKPVSGENLEDHDHWELECLLSAPHPMLLNSVLNENLEDLRSPPPTMQNWNVNVLLIKLGPRRC